MTTAAPTAETTQTIRITEDRKHIIIGDIDSGRKLPIKAWGKDAAPMVVDPTGKINKGRPVSAYDLIYEASHKVKLTPAQHAVPQKDTEAVDDFDTVTPTEFKVYTRRDLNGKYPNTAKPGPVTNVLDLNAVAALRNDYWGADLTLAELSAKYKISVPTARKYAFGELVWYA